MKRNANSSPANCRELMNPFSIADQNVTVSGTYNCMPSSFLLDPNFGQPLFSALKSFALQLQSLPTAQSTPEYWPGGSKYDLKNIWPPDATQVALAYNKQANTLNRGNTAHDFPTQLQNWKYDLGDIFLALLILRTDGPESVNAWVMSQDPQWWVFMGFFMDNPTLREIGDVLRVIVLLLTDPSTLTTSDSVQSLLNQTLVVPPLIFTRLTKPLHAIGVRQFHVVKQHIRGYQLGEIAKIENILQGESRTHSTKNTRSTETDTFSQTVTTNEKDTEIDNTDHVDIKNEADNQVKEDTKVDGGVHAQYDGGSYHLQADLTASYAKSTDTTNKFASDVSKETTTKAVTKVTTQVTTSQTTKIIQTWEENEAQSFNNQGGGDGQLGTENVSGIYQWVEKVYLAQTFNLGQHQIFDITVPEPGAALLAMATLPSVSKTAPVPPPPLKWVSFPPASGKASRPLENSDDITTLGAGAVIHDLNPQDLDPDELDGPSPGHLLVYSSGISYVQWVARFGAKGVTPSPARFTSAGKAITQNKQGNVPPAGNWLQVEDSIPLADGYQATSASLTLGWTHATNDLEVGIVTVRLGGNIKVIAIDKDPAVPPIIRALDLYIGGEFDQRSSYVKDPIEKDLTKDDSGSPILIAGALPVGVSAPHVQQVSLSIEIQCLRLPFLLRQWQLQTFEKILDAWQQLQSDYQTALAGAQNGSSTVGPLGAADPDANRLTERMELKRACIALLDNKNATVRGTPRNVGVQDSPSPIDGTAPVTNPPTKDPRFLPTLPEPILQPTQQGTLAETLGRRVRWFEQAFEWENIAYVCYPYFWGRRTQWVQGLNLKLQYDDPLFINFLRAGYARVVVPVRKGFEHQVHCFLHMGRPWLGGELPLIGDKTQNPLYLDIAEEIKANTGGGETGGLNEPVGDPWDYTLPTTLIKLRKDGTTQDPLPSWVRVAKNPNPNSDGSNIVVPDPNYPTDPPIGPWTWQEENPPKSLPYSTS